MLYTVYMLGILLNNELQMKKKYWYLILSFYSLVKRHYSIYRVLRTLCSCTYEIFLYNIWIQAKMLQSKTPSP